MKKIKDFIEIMFVAGIAMLPIASFADDIKIVDANTVVIASGNRVDTVRKESDGFFYVSKNIAINLISRETEFGTAQPLSVTSDTTTINLNSIQKAINERESPIVNSSEFAIKWGQEKYVFKRKITQSKSTSTTAVKDSPNGKQVRTKKNKQINTYDENKPSKVMIAILVISLLGNLVWLCKQQRIKELYYKIRKEFLKRNIDKEGTDETSEGMEGDIVGLSQGEEDAGKIEETISNAQTTDLPQSEKDSAETLKGAATNGQVTEITQSNESVIFTFAKEIGIDVENAADEDRVYEKIRKYISTLEANKIGEQVKTNLSELGIKYEECNANAIIVELINRCDANTSISFEKQLSEVKNSAIDEILNKASVKPKDLKEFCEIIAVYIDNYFEKVIKSKDKTDRQKNTLEEYLELQAKCRNPKFIQYFKERLGYCFGSEFSKKTIDELRDNYKIIKKENETNATSKKELLDGEGLTTTQIIYNIPDDKQKMLDEYSLLINYGNDASTIERSIKDLGVKEAIGDLSITEVKNRIEVFNELSTCYGKKTSEDIEIAIKNKVAKLFRLSERLSSEVKDDNLKTLIEAINNSEDIESLDKALVNLVNSVTTEFAKKDSSIEKLHEEQKNLLHKILQKYQEVFNNEKIEEKETVNAFGAFATKTSSVIISKERKLQETQKELAEEKNKHEKIVDSLNGQLEQKKQKIRELSQECINHVSTTFETIRQSIENTCESEDCKVAEKFQQLVLNNGSYNLETFSNTLLGILNTELSYDEIKKQIKELCERALVENSWIHALTRMYLYVQQPKIAEIFEEGGVVTSEIERAFIITEQLLKEIGIELIYPMLFKDVYDDNKYEYRPLADINNIVGPLLVKELVGEKTNVLIDLHRVGFNSDTENAKPKVSKFS